MAKENVVSMLELLTLISIIFIFFLFFLFILKFVFKKDTKLYKFIVHFLQNHYLFLGFLISLVATLGSLFYSDIMGYAPCRLCWYQRIFMYPQVILFLIAFNSKRNMSIIWNSLILSLFGGLIALYHYMMQIGLVDELGCNVVGFSAKCSEFFSLAYGFITIPMMSLVAFALLIIICYGKIRACEERNIYNK
ncbi:MAG: disulfide bond formation protein B [Nanoarchaeota archaeon]